MNLADKVRQRRMELGWSQEELSTRMGYKSRTSINKIENGRPVTQKIIYRLSEVLDVPIEYLMGWEEEASTEKPATEDGFSEKKQALIAFAHVVPEDKAEMILRVMKSIVEGS